MQANVDTIRDSYTAEDRNQQTILTGDLHFATNGSTTPAFTLDGTEVAELNQTSDTLDLKLAGLVRGKEVQANCSATGGLTTYTTCSLSSPFATTGSLLGFSAECGTSWAKAMSGDVSFKKTLTSASGTVLTNGDNLSLGSGALLPSMLAVPVKWNPVDLLTFTTLVAPSGTLNTTRYDCKFFAIVSDKYGS